MRNCTACCRSGRSGEPDRFMVALEPGKPGSTNVRVIQRRRRAELAPLLRLFARDRSNLEKRMRVPSPRFTGRRESNRFRQHAALHSCDDACLPFAPRQRGEGGAAAPDEGPWEVGCDRRCSRARESLHRRLQKKKHESAPHPRLPPHLLPVATGRRDQHALSPGCKPWTSEAAPAFLRPAPAGRRWCGSTG